MLVHLRFYAELNDFLPPEKKQTSFEHQCDERVSVKHLVESLNIPHGEVDLILANGRSVDFSYIVQDGDQLSVYPVFESIDISPAGRLRPKPLRRPNQSKPRPRPPRKRTMFRAPIPCKVANSRIALPAVSM